ncbi:TIGR02922 family protein [Paraferrimonas sedimenticola]|uniref:TIGR02922 family protein n=1 Tax=Paraferrimonas sedimenticola TaxID=375674 RepID=A0AA37RZ66_9GAMM|nr:TIGR02922 family protein [Paraferrimonas sedimenticola]GLP98145.1 hypothetical protein GCM10007895_34520 [Paraferrimonas sedimenticola]
MQPEVNQVTVFYYDSDELLTLKTALLSDLNVSNDRVILPQGFRHDKIIVAVCEGEVKVLNALGDRVDQEPARLQFA